MIKRNRSIKPLTFQKGSQLVNIRKHFQSSPLPNLGSCGNSEQMSWCCPPPPPLAAGDEKHLPEASAGAGVGGERRPQGQGCRGLGERRPQGQVGRGAQAPVT